MNAATKLTMPLIACLAILSGCGGAEPEQTMPSGDGPYTAVDFDRLRWIEGRWKGSGPSEHHFFEEYRFVGDTLVVMKASSDSTFSDSTGGGTVAFSGGEIIHQNEGAVWRVAGFDSVALAFEPVSRAANSFIWRHESDTTWVATVDAPGGEQTYRMARVRD